MFFIGKESYGKSDDNNNCNYRIFYDSVHRNVCTLRHGGIPDLSYTSCHEILPRTSTNICFSANISSYHDFK